MNKERLKQLENTLTVVAIGLILIGCVALWGVAEAATARVKANQAQVVARCESIDGAEWDGNACYYNGVKLNFKEGYDAPEE